MSEQDVNERDLSHSVTEDGADTSAQGSIFFPLAFSAMRFLAYKRLLEQALEYMQEVPRSYRFYFCVFTPLLKFKEKGGTFYEFPLIKVKDLMSPCIGKAVLTREIQTESVHANMLVAYKKGIGRDPISFHKSCANKRWTPIIKRVQDRDDLYRILQYMFKEAHDRDFRKGIDYSYRGLNKVFEK